MDPSIVLLDWTSLGGPHLIRPGMIGGAQWSGGCLSAVWSSFILDWDGSQVVMAREHRTHIEMSLKPRDPCWHKRVVVLVKGCPVTGGETERCSLTVLIWATPPWSDAYRLRKYGWVTGFPQASCFTFPLLLLLLLPQPLLSFHAVDTFQPSLLSSSLSFPRLLVAAVLQHCDQLTGNLPADPQRGHMPGSQASPSSRCVLLSLSASASSFLAFPFLQITPARSMIPPRTWLTLQSRPAVP